MISAATASRTALPPSEDDERSLLARLEALLEREEGLLATRDADGLARIAEEREHVAARLGVAARARRLASTHHGDEAELVDLYTRLRQRHEVRARVVQRHEKRNATAIGVIAQAGGQAHVYEADGRVTMRYAAS